MDCKTQKTASSNVMKVVVVVVAILVSVSVASVSRCPEGQYFNADSHSCLTCSTCPRNQIIRVPCSEHLDTVCGPFFEFYEFHQAPRPTLDVDDLHLLEDSGGRGEGEWLEGRDDWSYDTSSDDGDDPPDDLSDFDDGDEYTPYSKTAGQQGGDLYSTDHWQSGPEFGTPFSPADEDQRGQQRPSLQSPGNEENQWKVLALAMIIVLCVVCVFLIIVIFILCYLRSRRVREKNAIFSSANGPSEPYRTSAPRYVPVPIRCAHAQTAAAGSGEISDSGATSGVPNGNVAGDSHGPPAPSSDYVYFKSPQNGNDVADV